ncbi:hypothetical protein SAMN05216391_10919 [Lachnospiraceae bacterium KHCPX20]|nr:hypothetical protein SAMN05216391_10919 [Lachnospiraceae bacterium KHCPX20]
MRKIICCLMIVGFAFTALAGCGEKSPATVGKSKLGYCVKDYVDPATGVHYLICNYGRGVGMSVRYNADGTIMVDSTGSKNR